MTTVTDKMFISAPVDRVYECCWNAELWPKITPHVREIEIVDAQADQQHMRMVVESEGKLYRLESTRTTVPGQRIFYRQNTPPDFLAEHCGEWRFYSAAGHTRIELTHQFVAKDTARQLLGLDPNVDVDAYIAIRLKKNGLLTLSAIKQMLEQEKQPNQA
jgi:uncharacterized membrane protein